MRPFFITGYPRSGTTLLASMVGRHSEVTIPPETHFFRNFMPQVKGQVLDATLLEAFCNFPRISDLGLDRDSVSEYLDDRSQTQELLGAALSCFGRKNGAIIVGEKTPEHILFFNEINSAYPGSLFVYIVRDGRDCVFSNIKEKWAHQNPIKQAAEWSYFIRRSEQIIRRNRSQIYVMRYENLVTEPVNELSAVCSFIGIEFEPNQLSPSASDPTIPTWELEWKAKAAGSPDKHNLYKWKKSADKIVIAKLPFIMHAELKKYGYEGIVEKLGICGKLKLIVYKYPIYDVLKWLGTFRLYKMIKTRAPAK